MKVAFYCGICEKNGIEGPGTEIGCFEYDKDRTGYSRSVDFTCPRCKERIADLTQEVEALTQEVEKESKKGIDLKGFAAILLNLAVIVAAISTGYWILGAIGR
jgi:phage FluMu protein Com